MDNPGSKIPLVTTRFSIVAAVLLLSLTACHAPVPQPWGPDNMAVIPAGDFLMGSPSSDGFTDERPQRSVFLSAFRIDRYEVTNAQYEQFVKATGHAVPTNPNPSATIWTDGRPFPGSETHPVVNVNWHDAVAYCAWAGKRLPTEAEWEKAARGTDARLYPWGNEWSVAKANSASYWAGRTIEFNDTIEWKAFWVDGDGARMSKERGLKGVVLTLPVGTVPEGVSPYGLFDMAGNASEWVQDWFEPHYYLRAPRENPKGPDGKLLKVVRGGSWLKPAGSLRTADRDYGLPTDQQSGTGFRCAKDAR
jgi:formylglycine-generating enzyme required for sulfatase activity